MVYKVEHEASMGQFLREYAPEKNLHTFLNGVLTRPLYAFTPEQNAVVVQQKTIPDWSFWQGDVDFAKMRAKTNAGIMRAGQNLWVDSKFERNWAIAKSVGMLRGAYWFYDDRIDPGRQADKFIELLRADPPEMEVWCDWETSYGGSFGSLKNVVAFMERVEAAGFKIGMYTGYYWFVSHSNALLNAAQYAWLKTRPLWLAWYTSNAAEVKIPAPWSELLLWQFGTPAVGHDYGCLTLELDMNYINLTDVQFGQRYGGGETTTTPPSTGEQTMQIIKGTALGSVRIRLTPAGADFNPSQYLVAGDKIEASENSNQWLKLTKINGVAVVGEKWVSAGTSKQYISWNWFAVEDPTPPGGTTPTLPTFTIYIDGGADYESVTTQLKPK